MKNNKAKEMKEQGIWEETRENITEGARAVGEEARDLGEKISSYSEIIFGKIAEKTEEVFQSGKDLTRDAVNKAQEIAEKYRDRMEIRKLNDEKKKIATQLGMNFYLMVKNNNNKVPETILRRKVIRATMHEIEDIDRKILELTEEEK